MMNSADFYGRSYNADKLTKKVYEEARRHGCARCHTDAVNRFFLCAYHAGYRTVLAAAEAGLLEDM